jgi:hypothetical protein
MEWRREGKFRLVRLVFVAESRLNCVQAADTAKKEVAKKGESS